METANQLYRSSQSPLPFKEWLKREQIKGKLKIHQNEYVNANGNEEEEIETIDDALITENQEYEDNSKNLLPNKFFFGLALGIGATLLIQKLLKK
jgi:hypothetical protein